MKICSRKATGLILILAILSAAPMTGQQQRPGPPRPEAQIEAMKRLDYMAGEWSGDGWMDFGERRATFRGSEIVQKKLDGTALLVEGSFFAKMPGSDHEVPVHTTLGVITFDPQTKQYRFHSWLATGTSGERPLEILADGWQWETTSPRGTVRYRMTLTESGEWFETGERSADGEKWNKFFEMTLRKK